MLKRRRSNCTGMHGGSFLVRSWQSLCSELLLSSETLKKYSVVSWLECKIAVCAMEEKRIWHISNNFLKLKPQEVLRAILSVLNIAWLWKRDIHKTTKRRLFPRFFPVYERPRRSIKAIWYRIKLIPIRDMACRIVFSTNTKKTGPSWVSQTCWPYYWIPNNHEWTCRLY